MQTILQQNPNDQCKKVPNFIRDGKQKGIFTKKRHLNPFADDRILGKHAKLPQKFDDLTRIKFKCALTHAFVKC